MQSTQQVGSEGDTVIVCYFQSENKIIIDKKLKSTGNESDFCTSTLQESIGFFVIEEEKYFIYLYISDQFVT